MEYFEDEIIAEVRRHRAELLDDYGGLEGYMKHIREDRPRLEREGWRFASPADKDPPSEQPYTSHETPG